jgi:F0F1-type ATP synthase assembly protein I
VPQNVDERADWRRGLSAAGPYVGLGLQLAGTMVFYILAGYGIDYLAGTDPWFLLLGAGIGMVAFFFHLARVVREMNKDTARRMAKARKESDETAQEQ